MNDGLHKNVPLADYLALDRCSSSRLGHIADRSPAYCRYMIDNPPEPTPAMHIGSAVHCALLEPNEFENRYGPAGVEWRTKDGKGLRDAVIASGRVPLKDADWFDALEMRDALYSYRLAAELLDTAADREVTALWTDPETKLACKARPDALGGGLVLDVKTSRHAAPGRYEREAYKFGTFRQAAFYLDGLRIWPGSLEHRVIAIEKTPPHEVVVYRIHPDSFEAARNQNRIALRQYADCLSTGDWYGYAEDEVDLMMPTWAYLEQKELDWSGVELEAEV